MDGIATMVIDPNKLFREGLTSMLKGTPYQVVAQASDVSAAIKHFSAKKPPEIQLVIFGLHRPSDSACQAIRSLRNAKPDASIVALTCELSYDGLVELMDAGVSGCLLTEITDGILENYLNLVILGETVLPTQFASMFLNERKNMAAEPSHAQPNGLSRREAEILRYLVNGFSNKVIAGDLGITEATVKVHLKAVMKKISVTNRTQAAIWAINNGFDGIDIHHVARGAAAPAASRTPPRCIEH